MADFKKVNAKIDKITEVKSEQIRKAQAKLTSAKTALEEATAQKEEAYNLEDDKAYTKAKQKADEASALIEMYSKKLIEARALPLDYTEAVKEARAITIDMTREAQIKLRALFAEIDNIVDVLYNAVSSESEYLANKIGVLPETKLLEIETVMPFVRSWNVDIRSKMIYGYLTDMKKDASAMATDVAPRWYPNKH